MPERRTLDPKLDVVFKMLFAAEQNEPLLRSFLNAVLEPETPIRDLVVINPEVTLESVSQHGAILDVRVRLADGRQIDVEMQAADHTGLTERFLFYWARAFSEQLQAGRDYGSLMPVIGVFILAFSRLPGERLHSMYQILETQRRDTLTEALKLHFLELPKLALEMRRKGRPGRAAQTLLNWCHFFAAESDNELEQLAMTDRDMQDAKTALEQLSADPKARRLAEERRLAEWNDLYIRGSERRAGRAEGRVEGQVELLLRQLRSRFGEVPLDVEAKLRGASPAEIERVAERVLTAATLREAVAAED